MASTLRMSARTIGFLLLGLLAPLTACSADNPQSTAVGAPAPTSAEVDGESPEPTTSPSDEPSIEAGQIVNQMHGWEVTLTLDATDRYRQDFGAESTRIHLLPMDVVSDPEAERWGDIFVWSPTRVYDPVTQRRQPLPADPMAWLRAHPGGELLRERRVALGDAAGRRAWQFDILRDGSEIFGDREGGLEGDGAERLVLWRVDGTLFVAQAGTFLGKRGLLADDDSDDVLRQVLASATYTRRST